MEFNKEQKAKIVWLFKELEKDCKKNYVNINVDYFLEDYGFIEKLEVDKESQFCKDWFKNKEEVKFDGLDDYLAVNTHLARKMNYIQWCEIEKSVVELAALTNITHQEAVKQILTAIERFDENK